MSENSNPFNNMSKQEFIMQCFTEDTLQQLLDMQNGGEGTGTSSSQRKKRRYIERGREEGHARLVEDYFSENPTYTDIMFRRRFRMRKHVFLRIVQAVENHSHFFQMKVDGTGRQGLSPLQKCTAAIRMLAYGVSADAVDDNVRIGESTARSCLKNFVEAIIEIFGAEYLRKPTAEDVKRLLEIGERRGFPGMMGSIDCMHWVWKNCPVAWKGMFVRGDHGKPTIMLEVVASADLWIWHAFFGVPGSCNDINVLDRSPVFNEILEGRAPEVQYTINETQYNMGYYLTDGIYPEWETFVKSIPYPQGPKRKLFAQAQEAARKDVERALGVLQARFAIIRGPALFWDKDTLGKIMRACIIMHNMIVEDEREEYEGYLDFSYDDIDQGVSTPQISHDLLPEYEIYLQNNARIRDRNVHQQLKADLVEHLWKRFGDNQDNN